jgi:hypothetical protein
MASSSERGSGAIQGEEPMDSLFVPEPLGERLGHAAGESLMNMFAEVHRIGEERLDRRIAEVSAKLDRKGAEIKAELRLEMATLKFDLLKWNFLFWIGQLAALTAILNVMLRDVR